MELTWEDISKKLSDAADYTVKETEKLTGMAKLKYKAANEKSKLNSLYQSLGRLKYAESLGEESEEGAYETIVAQISETLAEIKKMETEMASLRSWRLCVGCGAKIGSDMAFCPKCGTKQQPIAAEPAAEETAENGEEA